jgi:hypothetical protein
MTKNKPFVVTFSLALVSALALPGITRADGWNQATKISFSAPVEVPRQVLPAGTYWFTLADNMSDRNVVQIWNSDRSQLLNTILAIPDYRLKPSGKTVINFEERPAGQPEAIHSWFYPGSNHGEEFVYPKARATELAKQVKRPVLAMPDKPTSDTAHIKQTPVKAVSPAGEEIEVTEVVETEEIMVERTAPTSLPKTGSLLPFWALIGFISVTAALVLRRAIQKGA